MWNLFGNILVYAVVAEDCFPYYGGCTGKGRIILWPVTRHLSFLIMFIFCSQRKEISLCHLTRITIYLSRGVWHFCLVYGLRFACKKRDRCCIKLFFDVHFVVNNHIDGIFHFMCSNYIGAQFLETFYLIRRKRYLISLSIFSSVLANLIVNVEC